MKITSFKELEIPSNNFYNMVEHRAKSKAPVSAIKLVQKSSNKYASQKPVTGVLLTWDPPSAKPHWTIKAVIEVVTKNRSILKGNLRLADSEE